MRRSAPRAHRTVGRVAAAATLTALALLISSRVGSAATAGDTASAIVTLDTPGTLTLDAFDPDLGSLTAVQVWFRADVTVQVCIENTGQTEESMAGGTATATLTAEFPGGASETVTSVDASTGPVQLDSSDGTADCADGFDDSTGHFPDPVTATDIVFVEQSDQNTNSATLTSSDDLTPFIGDGTIAVTYTPASDTDLVRPADWDNLAVAQGQLQATVTYTYSPETDSGLPITGSSIMRIITIAAIAILAGTATVLAARRWRASHTPPPASS